MVKIKSPLQKLHRAVNQLRELSNQRTACYSRPDFSSGFSGFKSILKIILPRIMIISPLDNTGHYSTRPIARGGKYILTTIIDLIYIVEEMFKDDNDLSSDLEWMLQSNQIEIDVLIEALVSSYYQQIYTNALSRLVYPEEAHRSGQEILVQVILRKKEYRGKTSMQDWIESIASEVIDEYKTNLENFHFLNPKLIRSIQTHQEEDTLSDLQIRLVINEIKSKVKGNRISKSNRAYVQLIGLTSFVIIVAYFLFSFNNGIFNPEPEDITPSSEENSIQGAVDSPRASQEEFTPTVDSLESSLVKEKLPPLTMQSSSEEIRKRISISSQLWNTMWADIVVTFYGPAAYVGPPFTERHQLWIDQGGDDFEIIGPPQGIPDSIEKIILSSQTSPNWLGFNNASEYAKLGSIYPWFSIKTETVFLFPFAINYLFNTIETNFLLNSKLSVIGEGNFADRAAVIIELTSPEGNIYARLWLDTQTGIILKEQFYDPHDIDKVVIESSLRKIIFDDITPTRRKDPENSTLSANEIYNEINGLPAQSSSTELENPMLGFPYRPSPPDFDLAQANILFAKTSRNELQSTIIRKYDIFADNYFLGEVEMIDPLKIICNRSFDGTKIAIANWGIFPKDAKDKIYWLDLNDLDLFQFSIPDTYVFWTSSSPDNQKIVVSGYDERDGGDRFFLIDSKTGAYELLPIRAGFSSIAWSPDGNEIAVLVSSFTPFDFKSIKSIRIFDVQTGDEKRSFIGNETSQEATNLEISLEGWIANFQIPLQDLSRCTSSP